MRRPASSRAFACCMLVLALCTVLPLRAADSLDGLARLAGTWARNYALSDDPSEAGKEHRVHPPFIGPGGPTGPIGGPGMGGPIIGGSGRGGYGRSDTADVERTRALMRFATEAPDEMMISVDGRAVTIASRTGRVTHLTADDKKTAEVTDFGIEVERRTKWDDGELVTRFKAKGGGGEGKHIFKRDGTRLTLRVIFDGDASLRTVKVKHVYELKQP